MYEMDWEEIDYWIDWCERTECFSSIRSAHEDVWYVPLPEHCVI